MNIFRRLLQETLGKRVALGLAVGTGFAGGIVTVLMARGLSHAINQVFIEGMGVRDVAGLLLALMGLALLRAALIWGSEASAHTLAARVKHDLRMRLFQHILDLGPAYLQGALYEPTAQGEENDKQVHTGKLVNIATEGIEALEAYFSQYLPQLMLAALIPVTLLVFIFPLDPLSAVVLLLTAPLIPIFMILIGSAAEVQTKRQWRSLSRMSAYFLDVLQGLTTLKLLGRSREQIGVIAQVSERYRQTTMSVLRVTFLSALALELVATLSTAVVAVEIGLRLLYGKLAFEQAFFVLLLAPEFYLPLRLLGTRFHAGIAGREAGKRIFEILDISSNGAGSNLKSSNISQLC
jgi:ATP-binding cassette subfamily C protein CydD